MDDTQLSLKETITKVGKLSVGTSMGLCPISGSADTVASPFLTTYKKVVDIDKTYGLDEEDLDDVNEKLQRQRNFLEYSYISNDQTGQTFCLKDCIVSSNHNPHRYCQATPR